MSRSLHLSHRKRKRPGGVIPIPRPGSEGSPVAAAHRGVRAGAEGGALRGLRGAREASGASGPGIWLLFLYKTEIYTYTYTYIYIYI